MEKLDYEKSSFFYTYTEVILEWHNNKIHTNSEQ